MNTDGKNMPHLPISKILAEDNIRLNIDPDSIEELAESVLAVHTLSNGEKTLLQPITLQKLDKPTEEGHTHQLRYGFRRYAAMKFLLEKHPEKCFWAANVPYHLDDAVYNEEDNATTHFRLVENIQREDMSLLEEAMAMKRIQKEQGMKQSELAKMLGKSKGWVSQRLALLRMDESVQLGVQEGKLGQAHVRELARIKKKKDQADVATKLLQDESPSVAKVKRAVKKALGETEPKEKTKEKTKEKPAEKNDDSEEDWEMSEEERSKQDIDQLKTGKKSKPVEEENDETPVEEAEESEESEESEGEEEVSSTTAPAPSEPSRGDVLQTMSHEEKLKFLEEDTERRLAMEFDGRKGDLEAEILRCSQAAVDAVKKGDAEKAAYYAGAEQALKFALGSIKSIRYVKRKVAS